jgi:lysophospholipase L1-like esterase
MEKWQKAGLAQKDKVHFTRAGYRLVGDMLYEALYNEIARQPQLPPSSATKSSKR